MDDSCPDVPRPPWWLKYLNFIVLQWLLVRFTFVRGNALGKKHDCYERYPRLFHGWKLMFGVVPLTGWWGNYRYVWKHGWDTRVWSPDTMLLVGMCRTATDGLQMAQDRSDGLERELKASRHKQQELFQQLTKLKGDLANLTVLHGSRERIKEALREVILDRAGDWERRKNEFSGSRRIAYEILETDLKTLAEKLDDFLADKLRQTDRFADLLGQVAAAPNPGDF